AVGLPRGLLADQAHAAPPAPFVVDKSGGAWQLQFIAKLVLIAADDPLVVGFAFGDVPRAILNARVVARITAKRKSQIEISERAALPDDERVPLGRILRGGFAAKHAVLDAP